MGKTEWGTPVTTCGSYCKWGVKWSLKKKHEIVPLNGEVCGRHQIMG